MGSCRFADLGGRDRGPGSDPAAGQRTSVGRDVAGALQRSPKDGSYIHYSVVKLKS